MTDRVLLGALYIASVLAVFGWGAAALLMLKYRGGVSIVE